MLKIANMEAYVHAKGRGTIGLRHLVREVKLLSLVSDHPRVSLLFYERFTASTTNTI